MNIRGLVLIFATLQPAFALDSRYVYVTSAELFGFGSFNDDRALDVLIVDRSSGTYRLGYQNAHGELDWDRARPSGMPNAESLTVGELNSREDGFALCGGAANRVHALLPGAAGSLTLPVPLFPTGLEPVSVAALPLDLGGSPEIHSLVIEGDWSPDPRLNIITDPLGSSAERVDRSSIGRVARGSRVRYHDLEPEGYGRMQRGTLSDRFLLSGTTGGGTLPLLDELSNLPPGVEFLHGQFAPGAVSFLFYVPGTSTLWESRASRSGSLSAPVQFSLRAPVRAAFLIRRAGTNALLAVFQDGSLQVFDFNSERLTLADTPSLPPDSHPTAVLSYDEDSLVVLTSTRPGGASDRFLHFHYTGRWTPGSAGTLPPTGTVATASNVIVYDRDPVLHEDARVVKVWRVPEWTTELTLRPAEIAVRAETYQGSPEGLAGNTVVSLGPPPAGATKGLVNQFRNDASLTSADAHAGVPLPAIAADPPGGIYDRSIAIQLITSDPSATAYYRFADSNDPAVSLAPHQTITPPAGTLEDFEILYYAQLANGTRSPLRRELYRFAGAPGEIDSDHDGVPDFVESDPDGGPDTESDGFTDFEELVLGTDPDDPASKPSPGDRPDFQSVFDLAVRPLSVAADGSLSEPFASPTLGEPVSVQIRSSGNALLGRATTANHASLSLPNPVALVPAVTAPGGLFVVAATPKKFDVHATASPTDGREIVALLPIPEVNPQSAIDYTYLGMSPADERAAWIAAAQTAYSRASRPRVDREISYLDSLALLVMERFLIRELSRRDPANPEIAELSLTGFRDKGPTAFRPGEGVLRGLESPGPNGEPAFVLHEVYSTLWNAIDTASNPRVAALATLAHDLHRVSAQHGDTQRGLFLHPFDVLRNVVRADDLDTPAIEPFSLPGATANPPVSYAAEIGLSPQQLTEAAGGLVALLALPVERPVTLLDLVVVSDSYRSDAPPAFEAVVDAQRYLLLNRQGHPYPLPTLFPLPIGTRLQIRGFVGSPFAPGAPLPVEVLSATLVALGATGSSDQDGDLLPDSFKEEFFGDQPVNPFADHDHDGYSTLQEAIEGTNPLDAGDFPTVPVEDLGIPQVDVAFCPGGIELTFDYPSRYDHRIGFRLESSNTLLAYSDTGLLPQRSGNTRLQTVISHAGELPPREFYRFLIYLR